jgi:hypothetical protein
MMLLSEAPEMMCLSIPTCAVTFPDPDYWDFHEAVGRNIEDAGYKDNLTYKDNFLGPAGINFALLHRSSEGYLLISLILAGPPHILIPRFDCIRVCKSQEGQNLGKRNGVRIAETNHVAQQEIREDYVDQWWLPVLAIV